MSEPLEQKRPGGTTESDGAWTDVAASLWAQRDKFAKPVEQGKSVEQIKPVEPEVNRWTASKTDRDSIHRLSLKSSQVVDVKEFRAVNPDAPADLQAKIGAQEFKFRHASTGEIDSGWKPESVTDGRLKLTKSYETLVSAKKSHEGVIESLPGVPPSFVARLQSKLDELPANVRSNLQASGYKIIAAPVIADAIPELRKRTPRGWDEATTFENSDGTHENVRKLIIAPMRVKVDEDWFPVMRPNTLVHHVGHALDCANGLSKDPGFQRAFKEDMDALRGLNHPIAKYFAQPGGPGAEEAFASLFGLALTGPENEADRPFLHRHFQNSMPVVKKQIERLR